MPRKTTRQTSRTRFAPARWPAHRGSSPIATQRQGALSTCADTLRNRQAIGRLDEEISFLPTAAQFARRSLLLQGFEFEVRLGATAGLELVVRFGRFNFEQHASLLLRYAHAVGTSEHAHLAEPVSNFLARKVRAAGSSAGLDPMLSVIERLIERHPREFEANRPLKAALTTFDAGPDRLRIATMANRLRGRIETITQADRTPNQAAALVQAKLLLGSFTDLFREIFQGDAVGACSTARTLMVHRHENCNTARSKALLQAVDDQRASTSRGPARNAIEAAWKPLVSTQDLRLPALMGALCRACYAEDVENLKNQLAVAERNGPIDRELREGLAARIHGLDLPPNFRAHSLLLKWVDPAGGAEDQSGTFIPPSTVTSDAPAELQEVLHRFEEAGCKSRSWKSIGYKTYQLAFTVECETTRLSDLKRMLLRTIPGVQQF